MKQLKISILMLLTFSVITGIIYPFSMTVIGEKVFHEKADGSLVKSKGKVVGSILLGQNFKNPMYFHCRPSAVNYDSSFSGGTNFGPSNIDYMKKIRVLADSFRKENNLTENTKIPSDIVLASASGLDPHISEEAAILQAKRIAVARGFQEKHIIGLIKNECEKRYFGLAGGSIVNVLRLNLSLDEMDGKNEK